MLPLLLHAAERARGCNPVIKASSGHMFFRDSGKRRIIVNSAYLNRGGRQLGDHYQDGFKFSIHDLKALARSNDISKAKILSDLAEKSSKNCPPTNFLTVLRKLSFLKPVIVINEIFNGP